MNFAPLDFTNYAQLGTIAFFSALCCVLIGGAFAYYLEEKKKRVKASKIVCFFFFGIGGLLFLGSLSTLFFSNHANDYNQEQATKNLMMKYDIKSVDWEDKRTNAFAVSNTGDRDLIITTHNDQRYIFNYTMNRETSEPTLLDMPIEGGKTPDRATTAEALLKDK